MYSVRQRKEQDLPTEDFFIPWIHHQLEARFHFSEKVLSGALFYFWKFPFVSYLLHGLICPNCRYPYSILFKSSASRQSFGNEYRQIMAKPATVPAAISATKNWMCPNRCKYSNLALHRYGKPKKKKSYLLVIESDIAVANVHRRRGIGIDRVALVGPHG